ncbi:AAA family ATPase [Pseudoxanthomonas sp. CF125]|uniref:AAA family ATPase n=1 Tax=Pseudoxanthomonas sp. CF125 TaxID=1855303 RepID=UPI00088A8E5E|nr:AAA family ATPase [Pseudoxanthomonas sp. CF125]SDQ84047.1 CobQ/CobB/MinD/ParA nucleotide binding domain-containing protein [Pseudoxanthomonas sp. CF125]
MNTISEFIAHIRKNLTQVDLKYVHPVMYIVVMDPALAKLDVDAAEEELASRLGLSAEELASIVASFGLSLVFAAEQGKENSAYAFLYRGTSLGNWLPLFDKGLRDEWVNSISSSASATSQTRALHFYGFKGGQARSTVLLMLAKDLVMSGYRVLAVDVDIEAPSLSSLLNARTSSVRSSLVGLIRGDYPEPVGVSVSQNGGKLDLLPAAPSVESFEMDYAAFLLQVTGDPSLLQSSIERLRKWTASQSYDFVLFDHRTGLSTSVLPVISAWPGSVVIATRPDSAALNLEHVVSTLLAAYPEYPGLFVNFSLDPEAKVGRYNEQEESLRALLLTVLADAIERGQDVANGIDLNADDLAAYFVSWYHDRAFLSVDVPEVARISKDNQESLRLIRELLGISPVIHNLDQRAVPAVVDGAVISPSGALDEGLFVETQGAARVLQPNLPSFYVFGRKGTGKTRLFRELCSRGLGFPLHSASDLARGLQSQSATAKSLLSRVNGDFETFWWTLLYSAISAGGEKEYLQDLKRRLDQDVYIGADSGAVAQLLKSRGGYFTFLIDGVETAVESAKTGALVEALFRFLSTLQNDPDFSSKVRFRLFIRSDLPIGIQNVEQQVHARRVDLRWDEASIFHYVLAEISRSDWFRSKFTVTCERIEKRRASIQSVSLSALEYEELLLEVFPQKLRRNNLLTMTFFRTYFSDAAGEGDSRSSFYPRVFGSFLTKLAEIGSDEPGRALDTDGKVSHLAVLEAFTFAAKDFINEVKQELNFALALSPDLDENRKLVNALTQGFSGLTTPFVLDQCVESLGVRLPEMNKGALRESLRRMKDMGIFEDHPSDSNKWRAGRLFKEGLGMKYFR